ncbi:MFS transporter [Oryzihumus sp.]
MNRLGSFGMGFLGVRLARDLGADLGLVGWVLTVFGACTIPSRIVGGLLANRFGARAAMVIGLLSCAAAQLLIALGTSVPVVIVGAVTLGLAYEIIEPATQALVAEAVPPGRRASSYSLLWAAMAVAGVAAGVLAAILTRWGIASLFVADAATSLVAAAVVAFLLPNVRVHAHGAAWRPAVSGRLLAWTVVGCVYATLMMVVVFMLPLAVDASGRPQSTTGWMLAVAAASAILAQRLVARWEGRIAPAGLLALGYAVLALGLCLWAWGTLPGLVVGAVLEGASGSFLLGTQQAIASRMAPPGGAATVMTVYGLSWGVGTIGAPLFGTALLEFGAARLWLTCAVAAAALAVGHGVHSLRADAHGKEIGRFATGGPIRAPHPASAASLVPQIRNGVRRQS